MSETFNRTKLKGTNTKNRRARHRAFETFKTYTIRDGGLVTLGAVEEYAQDYIARVKGSTKTISAVLAMIRYECTLRKIDWLTPSDADSLKGTLAQYTLDDYTLGQQKRALQMRHILAMTAGLVPDANSLKIKTMDWMFFDGAHRIGELLPDTLTEPRLMMSALTRNPDGSYTLNIGKTKTDRREQIRVAYPLREGPCAARFIPQYLALYGINKEVDLAEDRPLFPNMTKDKWRKIIKAQVQHIGLDPTLYSGHSFRAGWATDMFNAQVPYYVIKKLGRWRSDAALLYYRDNRGAHLIATAALDRLHRSLQPGAVMGGV